MKVTNMTGREDRDDKDQLQWELSERRKEIEQEPIPEKLQELAKRLQQALSAQLPKK